jgi:hypothetical protein
VRVTDLDNLDPIEKREWQQRLREAPWVWPTTEAGVRAAQHLSGLQSPLVRSGVALGVTVTFGIGRVSSSLWRLNLDSATTGLPAAEPDSMALDSWNSVLLALPRSLPLLWRTLRVVQEARPRFQRIAGCVVFGSGIAENERIVHGPSFGLALYVMAASAVFGRPVRSNVAALASIDARGGVGLVDGLLHKLDGLRLMAPQIDTVLVAADQEADIAQSVGHKFRVVAIRTAADALEHCFERPVAEILADAGESNNEREQLARTFFALALGGRDGLVEWSAVERAADRALALWPEVRQDERFQLEFTRAVAARHDRNEGRIPLPSREWLAERPLSLQQKIVAHVVQQSADCGEPSAAEALVLAEPFLPSSVRHALGAQAMLVGAVARLKAITSIDAPSALLDQQDLAKMYTDCLELDSVSFPLAEWYRLAGVLCDVGAFERAEDASASLSQVGGLGVPGAYFVALSRGCALVSLGRASEARTGLDQLIDNSAVPDHVRWSAVRQSARAALAEGDRERAAALHHLLRTEVRADERARVFQLLGELDVALAHGRRDEADNFAQLICDVMPNLRNHFVARHEPMANRLSREFPY